MRLAMLCHAATAATRGGRFPEDEPIEAKALDRLARRPPRLPRHQRCLTSPATRAVETAAALRLTAQPDPMLDDLDFGRWAGHAMEALAATEPVAVAAWLGDPAAAPHGGESIVDLLGRVGAWMNALDDEAGLLLAVTHAAVIRAAIVHALGAGAGAFWRVDVAPLTLATFGREAGRWRFTSLGGG